MSLAPGDLAVIVSTPEDIPQDRAKGIYGLTVVLLSVCGCDRCNYYYDKRPYWLVAGIPAERDVHSICHRALRKIPPAPMDESVPDEREAVS